MFPSWKVSWPSANGTIPEQDAFSGSNGYNNNGVLSCSGSLITRRPFVQRPGVVDIEVFYQSVFFGTDTLFDRGMGFL